MRILDAARKGLKPIAAGYGGGSAYGFPVMNRSGGRDWHKDAGVRYDNSIVFAAIQYAIDELLSVPMYVKRTMLDGTTEDVPNHPAIELIQNPNPWYGFPALLSGWMISEMAGIGGMSYTYKHRSAAGKLVGLEYIPHFAIRPYWFPGSGEFIEYYRMILQGGIHQIPVQDILAQRFAPINPLRPQISVGPLEAALLEVVTDQEAANYTAALVTNVGVTPHLISPASKNPDGTEILFGEEQIEQIKAVWEVQITGDNRGRPLIAPLPIKVDSLSFNPKDMNLEAIRNISEERICAVLRIPPGVLQLGTGLENQNNRASAEAVARAAARSFVKPLMIRKGMELTRDLIPELGQPDEQICWRWEDLEALQEDKMDEAKRAEIAVGGPYITVNEYRETKDLCPIEGGDVLRGLQPEADDEQDEDEESAERQEQFARGNGVRR